MRLLNFIDKVSQTGVILSGWATVLLVLIATQQVAARYLWHAGSIAMQELQWHLFAFIFLAASAGALKQNAHVRVDIFFHRFTPRQQKICNLFGLCFFLLPSMLVLIYYGWQFAWDARTYISGKAGDTWTAALFPSKGFLYTATSAVETWLRQWFIVGEVSASPGGLEARWLVKALIPLGASLLLLQAAAEIIRLLGFARSREL